jgi:hypothetical protein
LVTLALAPELVSKNARFQLFANVDLDRLLAVLALVAVRTHALAAMAYCLESTKGLQDWENFARWPIDNYEQFFDN